MLLNGLDGRRDRSGIQDRIPKVFPVVIRFFFAAENARHRVK
jgi:hypothetical protein